MSLLLEWEEEEYLKETFTVHDADGNGSLEEDELKVLFNSLGVTATNDDIKAFFDNVDEDEDETIDFDEFMTVVEKSLSEMVTSNDIMDAFKLVDPSDTGSVNVTQLAEGLETSEVGITINDAVSILNDCVMSHDQVLTFTEFRRLITDDTHHG